MSTRMILLALFLLAGPASVQAADTKASPPTTDATGATFTVTWTGGSAPWTAGFNDGSADQKGTGASPLTLKMPYHASELASGGYVCVLGSCAPLPVPAPSNAPPPGTTTHSLIYTEPMANSDGTPLTDLAAVRAYYRINNGAEAMATYPASSPTGGAARTNTLTVPATTGTLTAAVSAVDTAGNESPRSLVATKVIGVPPPPPPPQQFVLTATATAGGAVSGTGSYPAGTLVSPKEAAATGFVFAGWSGACSGAGACAVTMDSNKSVTATFAATPPPPPTECNPAGIAVSVPVPVGGKVVVYSGVLRCAP